MLSVGNIVQIYSSLPPLLKRKKIEKKERQKQKLFVMVALLKINCLEEAKEIEEPFGIWGGLNEVERKRNLIFS